MSRIATLENVSNALDTTAKFVRLIENEGITMEQFRLPIDDQTARRNLARFLKNGCQFFMKGPSALVIDRSSPFDPVKFIGRGWSIVEQDERSLALTEIDFSNVRFESGLAEGESAISGEEKLKRLMALPDLRLDAKIGQVLLEEKGQPTLRFIHEHFNISWFELAGTVLRSSGGRRYFLSLDRSDGGSWYWSYDWLDNDRYRDSVLPLLAS